MNGRRIVLLLVTVTVTFALLTSCGTPSLSPPSGEQGGLLPAVNSSDAVTLTTGVALVATAVPANNQERIVLKNATLQLVVENVVATLDSITKLAEDMGGWVINSSTSKSSRTAGNGDVVGAIAIRIPAAQLNYAIAKIKEQATSVDSEAVTGTDVTQEYVDLNSQLTNLRAAEKQLQTILDSATTTDDVLKIYNELVRVRGEIETTQGRINYYKQASDFSSISVSLRPPTVPKEAVQVDTGWSPTTTIKGAFNALINILQGLVNLLIIVVVLVLPLIIVIGVPAWLIYKLLRRYGWLKTRTRLPEVLNSSSNTEVENDGG